MGSHGTTFYLVRLVVNQKKWLDTFWLDKYDRTGRGEVFKKKKVWVESEVINVHSDGRKIND